MVAVIGLNDFGRDIVGLSLAHPIQAAPSLSPSMATHQTRDHVSAFPRCESALRTGGEELFALPLTEYPDLEKTRKVQRRSRNTAWERILPYRKHS